MDASVEKVCAALETFSAALLAGWSGDQTFQEAWGWNCPAVTRQEFANAPKQLAARIRAVSPKGAGVIPDVTLQEIPRRLQLLQANTLPQLYGGNCTQASATISQTLDWISRLFEPLLVWQPMEDTNTLPPALARRLKGISARLNQLDPDMNSLEDKVRRIKDAHDSAESLPADMEALEEARKKVQRISSEASEAYGVIGVQREESARLLEATQKHQKEASGLVDKCDEAYRITTTAGLAAAFDQRAKQLSASMWVWVFGLFAALTIGVFLGAERVSLLSRVVSEENPRWGAIAVQMGLSVLSLGAPLWFAWLATKQVGQRFRLAEDYAFKASVAKAYEGYRKEAVRIDPLFEARLFSSALARLEEAPLRLVESTSHGSPWHELMTSPAFQTAIDTVPEFKESVLDIFKKGADSLAGVTRVLAPKAAEKAAEKAIEDAAKV